VRGLISAVSAAVALAAAAFVLPALAAEHDNDPIPPFRIADDLYYIGASDIASYLIVTRAGLIVIDGGYDKTAPIILRNIQTLGFNPEEVKVLLSTHAHLDHAGGFAELKKQTGAKLFATQPDAELMARGGKGDFALKDAAAYPPVQVDTIIKDNQAVTMGGRQFVAHLTPGHTRGCTTWTFPVLDTRGAKRNGYNVMILCSNSILPMYKLAGPQESYPGIAADYEKSYAFWKSAPCDIFLGSHGQFFNMNAKRTKISLDSNPFVDPAGCKAWFDKGYADFQARLAKDKAEAAKP